MLRCLGIRPQRPKKQIEIPGNRMPHRIDTPRTRHLKNCLVIRPYPDIGHYIPRPAMLFKQIRAPDGLKVAYLMNVVAVINRPGRKSQVKLQRLLLEVWNRNLHG
jgi:hypothetical protein